MRNHLLKSSIEQKVSLEERFRNGPGVELLFGTALDKLKDMSQTIALDQVAKALLNPALLHLERASKTTEYYDRGYLVANSTVTAINEAHELRITLDSPGISKRKLGSQGKDIVVSVTFKLAGLMIGHRSDSEMSLWFPTPEVEFNHTIDRRDWYHPRGEQSLSMTVAADSGSAVSTQNSRLFEASVLPSILWTICVTDDDFLLAEYMPTSIVSPRIGDRMYRPVPQAPLRPSKEASQEWQMNRCNFGKYDRWVYQGTMLWNYGTTMRSSDCLCQYSSIYSIHM